jgi:hypothetical protein
MKYTTTSAHPPKNDRLSRSGERHVKIAMRLWIVQGDGYEVNASRRKYEPNNHECVCIKTAWTVQAGRVWTDYKHSGGPSLRA